MVLEKIAEKQLHISFNNNTETIIFWISEYTCKYKTEIYEEYFKIFFCITLTEMYILYMHVSK